MRAIQQQLSRRLRIRYDIMMPMPSPERAEFSPATDTSVPLAAESISAGPDPEVDYELHVLEPDVFVAAFVSMHDRLRGVMMSKGVQYADAEDSIGDALLTVWEKYVVGKGAKAPEPVKVGYAIDTEGSARGVIYRTAQYAYLGRLKNKRKENVLASDPTTFFAQTRIPHYQQPENEACWQETKREAAVGMRKLGRKQRAVMEHHLAGFRSTDAPRDLEMPPSTYRDNLCLARRNLAREPIFSHQRKRRKKS